MQALNSQRKAFLDMVAWSEGTDNGRQPTRNHGYDVIVGGELFTDYSDHPRKLVTLNPKLKSTAAGRYQLLSRWWDAYRKQLGLKDFSPESRRITPMQTKQRLDVPLSLKSVSDSGEFEGYGSVFGVKDSHDDVVMSGAFAASLRAWSDRKALPALLWQHRMDEPIGVYTEMKEDDVGLYVRGRLLIDDDPLAKRAHAHMKAGSLPMTAARCWI